MKNNKVYRCYVIKKYNEYFAGCITLNLFAFGKTLNIAQDNLDIEIREHFEKIILLLDTHNGKEVNHLLNRPAPLYMWLDYLLAMTKKDQTWDYFDR